MTVGELQDELDAFDDSLEIEIIVRYDAGEETERSYDLRAVTARVDPDTAREYARFECVEA